jgi:hypothetical protein
MLVLAVAVVVIVINHKVNQDLMVQVRLVVQVY